MWYLEDVLVAFTLLYLIIISTLMWLQMQQRPVLINRGTDPGRDYGTDIRAADSTVFDNSQDLFEFDDLDPSPEY